MAEDDRDVLDAPEPSTETARLRAEIKALSLVNKRLKRRWMPHGTMALRHLAGGAGASGEGPVEITMRQQDFGVVSVRDPNTGQSAPFPTQSMVMFVAQSFREMMDEGVPTGFWECRVADDSPAGETAAMVYIDGADIFSVKAHSKLA